MTVGGQVCTSVTGTVGTINAVPTGVVDECAATVVVHWLWQVDTTKKELVLWPMYMANLMTVQVRICKLAVGVVTLVQEQWGS